MAWTTDVLVSRVRRRAQMPDSDSNTSGGYTDQEVLDLAFEEVLTRFVPYLRDVRENYLVTSADLSVTSGTSDYRIPSNAEAAAPRDVTLIDSNNTEFILPQLALQDDALWDQDGPVRGFYVRNNSIRLLPTPDQSYTLRVTYYRRPSKLVPVSECFPVASTTSTVVTVTGSPSWTSGDPIDIVQADPHFDVLIDGGTPSLSGSDFTFSGGEDLSDIAEGDYVCQGNETCVPVLPAELHPALYSATAAQLLVELGDRAGAAAEMAQAERIMESQRSLLTPRVDGRPEGIVNRHSPLRRGGYRFRW